MSVFPDCVDMTTLSTDVYDQDTNDPGMYHLVGLSEGV